MRFSVNVEESHASLIISALPLSGGETYSDRAWGSCLELSDFNLIKAVFLWGVDKQ